MPLAKCQFLQNPSSYWVVLRHHPHRGSNPGSHRHCTQGYCALDHSANDADTNWCQKMLYELLYKENWCQQRVSKIKNQGRIRTRHRYLNLKNLRPRSDALDHSAITLDNTYSRNLLYQLLHVEYWCKQRVTKIKRQGVRGRILRQVPRQAGLLGFLILSLSSYNDKFWTFSRSDVLTACFDDPCIHQFFFLSHKTIIFV